MINIINDLRFLMTSIQCPLIECRGRDEAADLNWVFSSEIVGTSTVRVF